MSTLTGNYSGFCLQFVPYSNIGVLPYPTDQRAFFVIYGLGGWINSSCLDWFLDISKCEGCVYGVIIGTPVIGAGTIGNLRVSAVNAPGAVPNANSGKINVWIKGQTQPTSITCTLGTGLSCSDTANAVSVKDGEEIFVTIETVPELSRTAPTEGYRFVRVLLGSNRNHCRRSQGGMNRRQVVALHSAVCIW